MKNIIILTPIYPANDIPKGMTPVVHYFAKEWVKQGHNVIVFNYVVNFPKPIYYFANFFQNLLMSFFGTTICFKPLVEKSFEIDSVKVYRIPMKKYLPHTKYSKSEIINSVNKTLDVLEKLNINPDCILAHWLNPQIEIIPYLKKKYNVPVSLVMHDTGRDLDTIFKNRAQFYLSSIDYIGYRSDAIKRVFESKYAVNAKPFYCYSGIPEEMIYARKRRIISPNKFIYVGTLIKRKYPAEIIKAVRRAYLDSDFRITYIGEGNEEEKILKYAKSEGCINKVSILGRIPRKNVADELVKNDVFIMISKNETFGLVYLEAMAAGCITIASRDEGFDGIIVDGINGFLCKSGDIDELTKILNKIKAMDIEALNNISQQAIETAHRLTDKNVAKIYLDTIK